MHIWIKLIKCNSMLIAIFQKHKLYKTDTEYEQRFESSSKQ